MNKLRLLGTVCAFQFSLISTSSIAALIDFEDLTAPASGGASISSGYNDFNWDGTFVYNSDTHFSTGSASISNAAVGTNSAFNGSSDFTITSTSGSLFDFESGIFTSLYSSQDLTVTAFLNGAPVGSVSTTLDEASTENIIFGFFGVDAVQFVTSTTNQLVLDNLKVSSVSTVPVPAAVWLFGSGLLGLVGIARRKKA